MGAIIKFQHEIFNGQMNGTTPDVDVLYPKTSADQVEGLANFIEEEIDTSKEVQSVALNAGTDSQGPSVSLILKDDTELTSESMNPATTTAFGVTKLSNAIDSNAETEAATPKAVKTAYDLANNAQDLSQQISSNLANTCLKVLVYIGLSVLKKSTTLDTASKVNINNIVNVIAYSVADGKLVIINEGVTFTITGDKVIVNSTIKTVNRVKVVYEYAFV